jgi:DNA transformation protein and related proteins
MGKEFVDYVLEQLSPLGGVRAKRMFGGHGVYLEGLFFALVADDTLYLKALEDSAELLTWARRAIEAALRAAARKG